MRLLILNGSPRENGTVATLLNSVVKGISTDTDVEWIDVCKLSMKNCTACMVCREKKVCVLPEDDAHIVGRKIALADALLIGTPVHWGNMSAPLKLLFDRNVPVFMDESTRGIPIPQQKGKKAVLVTACTTPWPFNFILPESRGALRAVKEILHYGGYKVVGSVVRPGSRSKRDIPDRLKKKAYSLGERLTNK